MRLRDAAAVLAGAGLRVGQLRSRVEAIGHNSRWHYVVDGEHWSLGWGDISAEDLARARASVGRGVMLFLTEGQAEPTGEDYRLVGPLPVRARNVVEVARQTRFAISAEGGVVTGDTTVVRPTLQPLYDGGPDMLSVPGAMIEDLIARS